MIDYIMPVDYKYIDNIDSRLMSTLGYDIIKELELNFSGQRLLESKILMINEVSYVKNLNEAQVKDLFEEFNTTEENFFCETCIEFIKKLFNASSGNFFAMQTARDCFSDYILKPTLNPYNRLESINKRISLSIDEDCILSVLVPVIAAGTISRKSIFNSNRKCFYGDTVCIKNNFVSIANNYFI